MIDFTLISETIFIDIDYNDAPKFSTASISSCHYNGKIATPSELEEINKNFDFINSTLQEHILNGEHYERTRHKSLGMNLDIDSIFNYINNN